MSWLNKKELADGITVPIIDEYYDKALSVGASGGKILGSGGGGFFVFYVEKARQPAVRQALLGLKEFFFRFEKQGSKIVFNDNV